MQKHVSKNSFTLAAEAEVAKILCQVRSSALFQSVLKLCATVSGVGIFITIFLHLYFFSKQKFCVI